MDIDAIAREAIDCGFKIHRDLGPGLLESCTKWFWRARWSNEVSVLSGNGR